MDVQEVAGRVIQALGIEHDPFAPAEKRKLASEELEKVKSLSDNRLLVEVALTLVQKTSAPELQHHGLGLLQHVAHSRWAALTSEEQDQLATLSFQLLESSLGVWAVKSKAATFVAEVLRQQGTEKWQMLPALFNLGASNPMAAEVVCLVLRFLPEDVTVYNEDLAGGKKRDLLLGLTSRLPDILPYLYKLLESNVAAAVEKVDAADRDAARLHAAATLAALRAVEAYAPWAPLVVIHKAGLLDACAYLLGVPDFRMTACYVLREVAGRRPPSDETAAAFESTMLHLIDLCVRACAEFLERWQRLSQQHQAWGAEQLLKGEVEYGLGLCELMAAVRVSNLGRKDEQSFGIFLQQMLDLFSIPSLATSVLPFWMNLLKEAADPTEGQPSGASVAAALPAGIPRGSNGDRKHGLAVPLPVYTSLLELLCKLLRRQDKDIEDDEEQDLTPGQIRGRTLDVFRLVSSKQPVLAVQLASQQLSVSLSAVASSSSDPEALRGLSISRMILEASVLGLPDAVLEASAAADNQDQVGLLLKGIVQQLLTSDWLQSPELVCMQAEYFEALGRFLRYCRHGAAAMDAVEKLFSLLSHIPGHCVQERMRFCRSLDHLTVLVQAHLVPHMERIAVAIENSQSPSNIPGVEYSILAGALLVVANAAGREQQGRVADWLLRPVQARWERGEWRQQFTSSPQAFASMIERFFSSPDAVGGDFRFIYHAVSLLDKVVRRLGGGGGDMQQAGKDPEAAPATPPPGSDTIVQLLQWMLPPLLQLLYCVHAMWNPAIRGSVSGAVAGALEMSDAEKRFLVGDKIGGGAATPAAIADDGADVAGGKENGTTLRISAWLRVIRDSSYNFLGFAMLQLPPSAFFSAEVDPHRPSAVTAALVGDVRSMEMRHMRQLIRMVLVPFVKSCPPSAHDSYILPVLAPVLAHAHTVLAKAWTQVSLSSSGAALPARGEAITDELVQEISIHNLAKEVCGLLATIATPSASASKASGRTSAADSPRESEMMDQSEAAMSSASTNEDDVMCYLLRQERLATPAVAIALDALTWPDREGAHRALQFASRLVAMVSTGAPVPHMPTDLVGRSLFLAALRSLTLDSNAPHAMEIVGLLREILVRLHNCSGAPHEVLLTLAPANEIMELEASLEGKNVREQRQILKAALVKFGGGQLRALAPSKTSAISNVSGRSSRIPRASTEASHNEDSFNLPAVFGAA